LGLDVEIRLWGQVSVGAAWVWVYWVGVRKSEFLLVRQGVGG
jgi:hypothetical protein